MNKNDKINNSSLERLMELLRNQVCAIITAYKDTDVEGNILYKEHNIQRNRDLRIHFKENKIAVYILVGHWQETLYDTSYEVERSYVVPKPSFMSEHEFIDFIKNSMTIEGLTQNACILHTNRFYLLSKDGSTEELGNNISMNKIEQVYALSVRKHETPFVFDYVDKPTSNFGRLYFSKCNLLYFK